MVEGTNTRSQALLRSDGRPMSGHVQPQLGDTAAMAQEWAKHFYHSPAWLKNRSGYLRSTLDTSGNVLVAVTKDGRTYYARRDDRSQTPVPDSMVVPPGICERCFQMGEFTPATLVHHKTHLTPENVDDPHVTLSYDNFQRLCQDCHAAVHSGQSAPRVTFDERGYVMPSETDTERSYKELVMRLTETVDEQRNIHRRR